MRILVTGGVRSGKSRHAAELLSRAVNVTFIAPGRPADGSDRDWDERVALHRADRPTHWTTLETSNTGEIAGAVAAAAGDAVLIDCLGTWLAALLDGGHLWEMSYRDAHDAITTRIDALCDAVAAATNVVVVTNEVGLGVVPSHRSGMLFRDLLGMLNQRVAEVCDEVHLVVAGRVLTI